MYQSGKERNDERNQESNAANQGFHNGPGLEGGFFIHADKALNKPEAGIVKVRADRGTTCDGSGNAGKIQRRQLADAGHGGNNASGHRHGHGRRTNRDANQCRHNERNHDQRQAGGRNCMLPFVPLALSKLWMMSSRVTWMPRCAGFSFKISSQCSYCAAVFDLSFPV